MICLVRGEVSETLTTKMLAGNSGGYWDILEGVGESYPQFCTALLHIYRSFFLLV